MEQVDGAQTCYNASNGEAESRRGCEATWFANALPTGKPNVNKNVIVNNLRVRGSQL